MNKIQGNAQQPITRALTYRNATVIRRYASRLGLTDAEAQVHWEELMKFLGLCAVSDEAYCPSQQLDEIWHEFLLHTRDYDGFCAEVLGSFIHHEPTDDGEPERYTKTVRAMTDYFGLVNEAVWPAPKELDAKCHGKNCRNCKSYKIPMAGIAHRSESVRS